MTMHTVARNRHPLLELAVDTPRWDGAACTRHDPELFFHDTESGHDPKVWTAKAKDICASCPLIKQCGDWAIDHNIEHGIWGGLGARERARRRRQIREQKNRRQAQ